MEHYKILTSSSPERLMGMVNDHIKLGWKVIGSHKVVETHRQNKYRGSEMMETVIQSEYSQTIIKD